MHDNEQELAPTLEKLNSVTAVLEKNRDNIAKALPGLAKYQITLGETVASGPYYSAYVPNLSSRRSCSRSSTTRSGSGGASTPGSRPTTPVHVPRFRSRTTGFRCRGSSGRDEEPQSS